MKPYLGSFEERLVQFSKWFTNLTVLQKKQVKTELRQPYQLPITIDHEPEEAEPEQAKPVISDVVDEPKPAAPEVTEPEPDPKPEPIKPHPLVTKFFDCFASNLVWGQQRLEETPEQHTQIKVRDARWYWLQDFDALNPDTRITVRADILQQDAVDRLAAGGDLIPSLGSPNSFGIPGAEPELARGETTATA